MKFTELLVKYENFQEILFIEHSRSSRIIQEILAACEKLLELPRNCRKFRYISPTFGTISEFRRNLHYGPPKKFYHPTGYLPGLREAWRISKKFQEVPWSSSNWEDFSISNTSGIWNIQEDLGSYRKFQQHPRAFYNSEVPWSSPNFWENMRTYKKSGLWYT